MNTQIDNHIVRRLKLSSKIFAFLVFIVGFSALLGWQFNVEIFKRISANLPVIAPNTGLSFVFVSIAIFFFPEKRAIQKLQLLFLFFSLAVFLVGFLTLFEYIFGLNLHIDNFLFAQKMGEKIVRMSPQSAFNFFAVGLSLFFFLRGKKKSVSFGQAVIIAAGLISLVSFFGFIYSISGLYTIAPYKGMAAHTAVAFVMAFLGILALRPEEGFMKIFSGNGLSGLAARRLFVTLMFLIIFEILVMAGRRVGFYDYSYESLIHLIIVAGVFVYLIFVAFRSLDKLAEVERDIAHVREIDQAKTEFVSLASHQLRTPLTSVSWFTEMLLNKEVGGLNEKQKEYLSEIYIGNRRMIDLVDDILNTSRIDMGTLAVDPKIISLPEIAESVLEELAPLINSKELRVVKNYEDGLPKINADPEHMRIVMQNLISNSMKYTPPKGLMEVSLGRDGDGVLIKIKDSGYGIPKEQQAKIFTKMFRADNIRTRDTEGTGLGLYIARAIVRQSGGKIWFESKENKGTTFYVSFPLRKNYVKKGKK
jgi:signal transduction histidine kinase